MIIEPIPISTRVARSGTYVKDVFTECIQLTIPGIPFYDEQGRISGRAIKGSITVLPTAQNIAEDIENQCGNIEVPVIEPGHLNAGVKPLSVDSVIG